MSASGEKRRAPGGGRDDWQTPQYVLSAAAKLWLPDSYFNLDAAADGRNAVCDDFIDEEEDALVAPLERFEHKDVWLNPPFRFASLFASAALRWRPRLEQGWWTGARTLTILTSNATDTLWWNALYEVANHTVLVNPRIQFLLDGEPVNNNTTGSTLFHFNRGPREGLRTLRVLPPRRPGRRAV